MRAAEAAMKPGLVYQFFPTIEYHFSNRFQLPEEFSGKESVGSILPDKTKWDLSSYPKDLGLRKELVTIPYKLSFLGRSIHVESNVQCIH